MTPEEEAEYDRKMLERACVRALEERDQMQAHPPGDDKDADGEWTLAAVQEYGNAYADGSSMIDNQWEDGLLVVGPDEDYEWSEATLARYPGLKNSS